MQLFFITGLPKTGSTWLANMLNDTPHLQCLGEGRFFSSGLNQVPSLYDAVFSAASSWVDYAAERKFNWLEPYVSIKTIERRNYVCQRDKEVAARKLCETMLSAAVTRLMTANARPDTEAIGDKTPAFCLREIETLNSTFPDAKLVFLHRGVHDFLASYIMHFHRARKNSRPDASMVDFSIDDFLQIDNYLAGRVNDVVSPGLIWHLATKWKAFDDYFASLAASPKVIAVSYESLREKTLTTLSDIVEFLLGYESSQDLAGVVEAWGFDAPNMAPSSRAEHVNSRAVGYGAGVFSKRLSDVIAEAVSIKPSSPA